MSAKRYTVVRTTLGDVFITAERGRLLQIGLEQPHAVCAVRNDDLPLLRASAQAIVDYLRGERTDFSVPLPMRLLPFQRDVLTAVQCIPYGQAVSADDLARRIGKPHAVRAVETICRTNPYYILVPSHRVILSEMRDFPSNRLLSDNALRQMERRHLDKARKRR